MFMRKAGSSFSGHPGLYAKSAAACALGSLAMALASHGSLGTGPAVPFVFVVATLVFSVGNALLITMWGELWSTLATGKVGRCLYTSYIIAIVLYLLMIGLPVDVRVGLLMLLPAVSCLILHHAQSEPKRDQGTVPTPPPGSMAPWLVRALVATFALNFVWGVALPLLGTSAYTPDALELATSPTPAAQKALRDAVGLPGALSTHAGFLVTLGCLVVPYLYMVTAKPEVEAFTLYPPVGCALAGGLALALVLPEELSFIAYGLAFLGGACLDMLIMLVATDMAYRMQRPVAITLGVTLLIGRLGSFVGRLALDLLATNQTASHGVILPACLLVIIVCGFAVFSSYHLGILYRIRPKLARAREHRAALRGALARPWPDDARERDPRPAGPRPQRPLHRRRAHACPGNREEPHQQHLSQGRRRRPAGSAQRHRADGLRRPGGQRGCAHT